MSLKRKTTAGFLALTTAAMMALPVYGADAAAEERNGPKQLTVYIGDKPVEFETAPMLVSGTTMVQFRAIFEELGFKVDWEPETRTVTGVKEGLEIVLVIDSDTALVNGQEIKLEQAARIENGTTLVPLRMIGETAGKSVNWQGYDRRVDIGDLEQVLTSVVKSQLRYLEAEDKAGVMSFISESSPAFGNQSVMLSQMFALTDMSYDLKSVKLLETEGNEAVIESVTHIDKLAGPDEVMDQKSKEIHIMVNESGSWKFVNSAPLEIDYLISDQYKDENPEVPDAERKAILALVEHSRVISEQENWEELEKIMHADLPKRDEVIAQAKQLGAAFDFKFNHRDITIIRYSEGEAWVRLIQESRRVDGPVIPDFDVETVIKLVKNDKGDWQYADTKNLKMEYLLH